MVDFDAPERPSSPSMARPPRPVLSRGLRIAAVFFGVVFGAYVAQKLKAPLGFGDGGLFLAFSLVVMAVVAMVLVAAALLVRAIHRR
jgi:hypothetical protein